MRARTEIAARLRGRRQEIERATIDRVYGVATPPDTVDPDYLRGLRTAVSAAIDYAQSSLEFGEARVPAVPPALLIQARLAARNGIGIDTVLRRYLAGYSLLGEFLIAAAEESGLDSGTDLTKLLQGNAALFDRLLAAVSEEHSREAAMLPLSIQQRRLERIKRLLAGEPIDATELNYEFEGFHIGLVGSGPGVVEIVRELAARFDKRRLSVRCDAETVWAWLGARPGIEPAELEGLVHHARTLLPPGSVLALGEPGLGPQGWRLTHRQARAILPVARETKDSVVRYAEHALLATVLQDEVMFTSLHELFLLPLRGGSDDGAALRETLKAYFAAGGRISSAAAALGVSRRTVNNRIRTIEKRIGGAVEPYAVELQTALRLAELEDTASARTATDKGHGGLETKWEERRFHLSQVALHRRSS